MISNVQILYFQSVTIMLDPLALLLEQSLQCSDLCHNMTSETALIRHANRHSRRLPPSGFPIHSPGVPRPGANKQNNIQKVISNYTKKLAATDPEANPIRGPPQPPSWELPEGSDFPDVSDDESESDEANNSTANNTYGDKPVSLSETRKEMEERMEKKVECVCFLQCI